MQNYKKNNSATDKEEKKLQSHSPWEGIAEPWYLCLCRLPWTHLLLRVCFTALCFQLEVLHTAKGHGVFFSVVTGTSCVALDKSLNLSGVNVCNAPWHLPGVLRVLLGQKLQAFCLWRPQKAMHTGLSIQQIKRIRKMIARIPICPPSPSKITDSLWRWIDCD